MSVDSVVVLDNGGSSCKIGMAGTPEPFRHAPLSSLIQGSVKPGPEWYAYAEYCACYRLFPNAVGRSKGERQSFVGDQIVGYPDASSLSLKRPFDR